MKSCRLDTTFFFAAVNDRTLPQSLRALQTQHAVTRFVTDHQGEDPASLQRSFVNFAANLAKQPPPLAGSSAPPRAIKTGGHNE